MKKFHFFTRDWEKNNKKYFHSVEIGNYILTYINTKRVFFDSFRQNPIFLKGVLIHLQSLISPEN